jgi:tetratricopeptide (TPR) repeat protein
LLVLADPPRAEEAWATLTLAREHLDDLGSELDRLRWERTAAAALLLGGDVSGARALAESAASRTTSGPEDRAVTLTILGDVLVAEGSTEEGRVRYRAAVDLLLRAPATRAAARAWRDLGDRFVSQGRALEAASCFEHALTIVGLPERSPVLHAVAVPPPATGRIPRQ